MADLGLTYSDGPGWDYPFPVDTAPAPPGSGWQYTVEGAIETAEDELRRRLGLPETEGEPYVPPPAPAPPPEPERAAVPGGLLLALAGAGVLFFASQKRR